MPEWLIPVVTIAVNMIGCAVVYGMQQQKIADGIRRITELEQATVRADTMEAKVETIRAEIALVKGSVDSGNLLTIATNGSLSDIRNRFANIEHALMTAGTVVRRTEH